MELLPIEIRQLIYRYHVKSCLKPKSFQNELFFTWVNRMGMKLFHEAMKNASCVQQLKDLMLDVMERDIPEAYKRLALQPWNIIYNRLCCMISDTWYVSVDSRALHQRLLHHISRSKEHFYIRFVLIRQYGVEYCRAILLFPEPVAFVKAFKIIGIRCVVTKPIREVSTQFIQTRGGEETLGYFDVGDELLFSRLH